MNENNRPADKSEGQIRKKPQLREISPEQLEILEAHRNWVESEGSGGKRADLSKADFESSNLWKANLKEAELGEADFRGAALGGANLQGAHLGGANLQGADLQGANLREANVGEANLQEAELEAADFRRARLGGANLQGANFREADLQGAYLGGANLQGANLQGARLAGGNLQRAELAETSLRDANLQGADLSGVKNLLGWQLAGANVSRAKLPEDIRSFEEPLEVVAESSKNARKLFFGMLAGCAYAVLTIATTNDARLLTNSDSSPLPIIGTQIPIAGFYLAAPLILLGLHFYFNLYLQGLWENLARLPAIFPDGRLLNEKAYPWLLNSLVCAHFRLLRRRRPYLSRLKVFISVILTWWIVPATIFLLWGRYLPRHDWKVTSVQIVILALSVGAGFVFQRLARGTLRGEEKRLFTWNKILKDSRTYKRAGAALLSIVVGVIFYFISLGAIDGVPSPSAQFTKDIHGVKRWVPWAFEVIGYRPSANLAEADVSTKPANYWELSLEDREKSIKGAFLRDRDLRYAIAHSAFLVRADLSKADLQGANLREANLQGADLRGANLQGANLQGANLQGTNLRGAKNLTVEQLSEVETLYETNLDPELTEQIKAKCAHLLEKPK